MRVIVTGSRAWPDAQRVYDALSVVYNEHGPFTLVHGACPTGADFFAARWAEAARGLGVTEEKFRADWEGRGRAAGPERNARMIAKGANLVLAFPLPEGKGTQGTIKLARQAGIDVKVVKRG
jgi:hypothetical protein